MAKRNLRFLRQFRRLRLKCGGASQACLPRICSPEGCQRAENLEDLFFRYLTRTQGGSLSRDGAYADRRAATAAVRHISKSHSPTPQNSEVTAPNARPARTF